MVELDWRSESAYRSLYCHDAPGFAWEFLRRNPEFQADVKLLSTTSKRIPTAAQRESFARKWGVRVKRPSELLNADAVQWTPRALPSVVVLTDAISDLTDPRFQLVYPALESSRTTGRSEDILRRGSEAFRIHRRGTADPPAVFLPLDKLFDVRTTAALRLWRVLAGRNPGPNPAALPPARRKRLILALRALDGRLGGASYHDLAVVLLKVEDMPDAAWQGDERRGQVIRLAALGTSLMRGGYRDLLLYPYRRRI